MNSFTELQPDEMERVEGGYPTLRSSFFYDLGWTLGVIGGAIRDGASAFGAGAAEGGYAYGKLGYR